MATRRKNENVSPLEAASAMVQLFASESIKALGEDESPCALIEAVSQACSPFERVFIGRAILARCEHLADEGYKLGEAGCDPLVTRLAKALGKVS